MSVLHLVISEPQKGNWQLRSWVDDSSRFTDRPLRLEQIQSLTDSATIEYYTPKPRPEIGQQLFRFLDGDEHLLTNAIRDAQHSGEPLVLAIDARADLAYLPWEIMADDAGFLIERENPRIVPARWSSDIARGATWRKPAPRPLHTLFMAAAPEGGGSPLDFDAEEGRMTSLRSHLGDRVLRLTVEETGYLPDLRQRVDFHGAGAFDVFHLTGHAGYDQKGEPVFITESEVGDPVDTPAAELRKALPHVPPLIFLSGCYTARPAKAGAEHSLAGLMVRSGIPTVLGWGFRVGDAGATLAAETLYQELAHGHTIPSALSLTWRALLEKGVGEWHLLRLHFAGAVPGALVTAPSTWDADAAVPEKPSIHFLIPGDIRTKVPGPLEFVGRRRLLQHCLRDLRSPDKAGVLLHGTGGLGKSSVTARLADRLSDTHTMVALFGEANQDALLNALRPHLPQDAQSALDAPGDLRLRLAAAIKACKHRLLFVLDDYEKNQADPEHSTAIGDVNPDAAPVLKALVEAVAQHRNRARIILSSRYPLPASLIPAVATRTLHPISGTDEAKRVARLLAAYPAAADRPAALLTHARRTAAGNHRLLEWLFKAMADSTVIDTALLDLLEAEEERFRADLLARQLCDALPPFTRELLTALQVCEIPVPLSAINALPVAAPPPPGKVSADFRATHLATAVAWGLAYVWEREIEDQPHWLAAPFLRPLLGDPPATAASAVLAVLQKLWWDNAQEMTDARALELNRLALDAGDAEMACDTAMVLSNRLLYVNRFREAHAILSRTVARTGKRDPQILVGLAMAEQLLGNGELSAALFSEANSGYGDGKMDAGKAVARFYEIPVMIQQGALDEAEKACHDELLPYYQSIGADGKKNYALTLSWIAEILVLRDNHDKALEIVREQILPTLRAIGDQRETAVMLGMEAQILSETGHLDEALTIHEQQLPIFEALQDSREYAITWGKVADVLTRQGKLREAFRIHVEEEIPVFTAIGEARERAVTYGKVSDILLRQGKLREALRIRREEVLPALVKLNDIRELMMCRVNLAIILRANGNPYDRPEILANLAWAWSMAKKGNYPEAEEFEGTARLMGIKRSYLKETASLLDKGLFKQLPSGA